MKKAGRANQGQVLIVAALVIVMMLLSTALYVSETQKSQLKVQAETSLNLPFYKQGVQHTVVSALVNISNGGSVDILQTDLDAFNRFVSEHSFEACVDSDVTLLDRAPYQDGVWLTQNQSGTAVISACASFNVASLCAQEKTRSAFDVNVTSMIQTQGVYSQQNSSRQVQLTLKMFNEGQPALAKNFVVSVESDGQLDENWSPVDAFNISDYGDGTYVISFDAAVQSESSLLIWLSCQDQRGITLQTLVEPVLA